MTDAEVIPRGRRVHLEGATNFRDVGGYRTLDGRVVASGKLFRSDALHALSPGDSELLRSMGLRVAIDLRSERERHAEPCGLPWLRTLAVPLIQEQAAGSTRPEVRPDDGAQFLAELYRDILTESATQLGDVLRALGAVDGMPAVVHCSAGKDRTGMVIAVLLTVLGVDEETVLDDYVLSSRYRSEQRVAELIASLGESGIPAGLAAGLMGTPRWAMAEALASVRPQFGGMDSYLADAAGLQRWEIERLREQLLTG